MERNIINASGNSFTESMSCQTSIYNEITDFNEAYDLLVYKILIKNEH